MSKAKRSPAAKPVRRTTMASRAQRANQAVVKSQTLRDAVTSRSAESPLKDERDSPQAALVETLVNPSEDHHKETDLRKVFDFSPAMATVLAYQAKMLEIMNANMQLAFELAQRLATNRTPLDNLSVIPEFTRRRVAMFQQHSKEIAELSAKKFS